MYMYFRYWKYACNEPNSIWTRWMYVPNYNVVCINYLQSLQEKDIKNKEEK